MYESLIKLNWKLTKNLYKMFRFIVKNGYTSMIAKKVEKLSDSLNLLISAFKWKKNIFILLLTCFLSKF